MNIKSTHEKQLDIFAGTLLFVLTLVLVFFSLTPNCSWGDDNSAYITEGIALAKGCFDEQAKLNYIMHPTSIPLEAISEQLVYVWGYPIFHAITYILVGFDIVDGTSYIYYKISGVLAVSLLAVVLFMFLRRRFNRTISLVLSLVFCVSAEMRIFVNDLLSEPLFLLCAMLSLFLLELFLDADFKRHWKLYGVLLGVALWYTHEVRLNGISILFACAAGCIIKIISKREYKKAKAMVKYLLPFGIFLVLKIVSEAVLASATGNTSDVGNVTAQTIATNTAHYIWSAKEWILGIWKSIFIDLLFSILCSFTSTGGDPYGIIYDMCLRLAMPFVYISCILCLIGLVFNGFKANNLHLFLYQLVYFAVLIMLPYEQGMRYLCPVVIIMPMYFAYGLCRICSFLPYVWRASRMYKMVGNIMTALICALLSFNVAIDGIRNLDNYNSTFYSENASSEYIYSPDSIELFDYIRENVDDDAVIAFVKPRALYLTTERISFKPGINGHTIEDADYYLSCDMSDAQLKLPDGFELCFNNDSFALYMKQW